MAQYYYTVASLPTVLLDQDPPITSEYFLDTCRYTISEKDYQILQSARLLPEEVTGHPALEQWNAWETALRNELAKLRAANTGMDAEPYLREGGNGSGSFETAREAAGAANPAAGEDVLDMARWRYLDDMGTGHIFDMTALIIYYLKLQIAERRVVRTPEAGKVNYQEIYDRITAKIHQSHDGE